MRWADVSADTKTARVPRCHPAWLSRSFPQQLRQKQCGKSRWLVWKVPLEDSLSEVVSGVLSIPHLPIPALTGRGCS